MQGGGVQTPQAINQGVRALPEANCPQRIGGRLRQPLRTVPVGERGKGPPACPQSAQGQRAGLPTAPLPASPLPQPQPLGRFYSSRYQMSIIGSEKQQTL